MSGFKSFAQTAVGVAIAALIGILVGARVMLDLIGYTTAPDDFALLQKRLPKVLEWLFSTPWWVPSLLIAVLVALAAWMIVSGTKRAAAEEIEEHAGHVGMGAEQVKAMVDELLAATQLANPAENVEAAINARIGTIPNGHATVSDAMEMMLTMHGDLSSDLRGQIQIIGGKLESLVNASEARDEHVTEEFNGVKRNAVWVTAEFKEAKDKLDKIGELLAHQIEKVDRRFEWVDGGFRAILDRERMEHYGQKVEEAAALLLSPKRGEAIEDWSAWRALREQWKADLDAWSELADIHRVGASDRVKFVEAPRLEGEWPEDDLLPSSREAVAYRWVAVTYENFCAERQHVERAVMSSAYARPSMRGNPNILRDEDQPPQ